MTLTAEFPGGYRSPDAARMLSALPAYGVDAVALVPYAFSSANPPQVRLMDQRRTLEGEDAMAGLARQAHESGMRVMLKPQLWVRGSYPAGLRLSADADRARWFADYGRFLEHYAELALNTKADLFCIGTELALLTPYEAEWRAMIARVRELYGGPLTYAATQGQEFETLRFWDALDVIGLSNYYPLPDSLDASGIVAKVAAVQRRYRKPVILAEAGFSSYENPQREPWDETPRRLAPDQQARCYEALLRAFWGKAWFHGVYWWKVGTNGHGGPQDGSHTPWRKPAMEVVRRWYRTQNPR